jgi:hypothetical protein
VSSPDNEREGGSAGVEHAAALADARARLDELTRDGMQPLRGLPAGFADAVEILHGVAEETLQPKRRAESGSGWLRPFTPGGIGAPPWERGAESGEPGSIRIVGAELVIADGASERRAPLQVGAEATAALSDFQALTTVALGALIAGAGDGADPDPIRLWPEHFDVATTLGDEAAGTRANFGGSPGDADHSLPYLYVGPWADPPDPADPFWNALGFRGAELGYEELLEAPDQLGAAVAFLRRGSELLERR